MRILILCDSFPPLKSAASGMMNILTNELKKKHQVYIFAASTSTLMQSKNIHINTFLSKWRYQGHFKRIIFEIMNAFVTSFKVIRYRKEINNIDLIIWYSPSSFLWVASLVSKLIFKTKVIMILRDIFPDWLFHINVLKSKILYKLLSLLTVPQFLISDVICVQAIGDIEYLKKKGIKKKVVTLRNWESINRQHFFPASSEVVKTFTKKVQYFKKNNAGLVLTYLGSNSISQDMEKIFFFLSKLCKADQFKLQLHLFIRNVKTVRDFIYNLGINLSLDVNIYEQITPNQIPHILNKTDYGIVSLNANHITNNIPGKFVTYTQFSVPYLVGSFFGGTSLLIMVGVTLDTISQLESHLVMRNYDGFLKNGKRIQSRSRR